MGAAAVPALIMLIAVLFLPESPRWLCAMKRTEEATRVLQSIRGTGAEEELDRMRKDISSERNNTTYWNMWASAGLRREFFIAIALNVVQQVSSINTMMYYGAVVMEDIGFPRDASIQLTALLATAQGLGLIISLYLYSTYPRRRIFFGSGAAVVISLVLIAVAFIDITAMKVLAVFAVFSYLFTLGAGMSAGPFIIESEIFPTFTRGHGTATGHRGESYLKFDDSSYLLEPAFELIPEQPPGFVLSPPAEEPPSENPPEPPTEELPAEVNTPL